MATVQEQNKALVLRMYEEVWNRGNLAFIEEALSPALQDHPPKRYFETPLRGRESLREAAAGFRKGMPDFHDQMIKVAAERDRVAYLGRVTGTHTGELFGVPASGNRIDILGINFFRLEDGKIVERWGVFDVLRMMQQMGMTPAPQ